MAGDCMMKFCPICGEKIPSATSKFCMGCGLNLVDYRKKLEYLSASESPDKNNSSRKTTASGKSATPCSRVDEPQDMTRSLFERFGYLPHLYFNVSGEKNSTKIQSAVKAYAHKAANENIIFVMDDTLFGGGEDGFLVTTENIYVHNMYEKAFVVSWHEVQTFTPTVNKLNQRIAINGGREICLSGYSQGELNSLVELLDAIKANRGGQTFVAPKKNSPPRQVTRQESRPETSKRVFTMQNYVCDNPEAQRLYQRYTDPKPGDNEVENLFLAAQKGHAMAALGIALKMYGLFSQSEENSAEKEQCREAYFKFLNIAAEGGLVEAMRLLADGYYGGFVFKRNDNAALEWYEKILQSGYEINDLSTVKEHVKQLKDFVAAKKQIVTEAMAGVDAVILRACQRKAAFVAEKFPLKCMYYNAANCDKKTADKINSALRAYVGQLKDGEFPMAVMDSTVFGSADEGCFITNCGIYVHNANDNETYFIDRKIITPNNIKVRGLIIKDVYVAGQKIETSGCGYIDEDREMFISMLLELF